MPETHGSLPHPVQPLHALHLRPVPARPAESITSQWSWGKIMSISGIGSSQVFSTSALTAPTTSAVASAANDGDADDGATSSVSARKQTRSDFASLLAAVQQGDMTSAQQALTAVQSDLSTAGATYSPSSQSGSGQVPTDLQTLFSAVQQGDTTSAQQALQKLQSDASQHRAHGAHGHGPHHHHAAAPAADPLSLPMSPTDPASDVTGNSAPQNGGTTIVS